jgi:hypothetical protein
MMMMLRSAVDVVIPRNVFGPPRQACGQILRRNARHLAFGRLRNHFHNAPEEFSQDSDRIGHVIRPASAVIHSSVALPFVSRTMRRPDGGAPFFE